MILNAPFEKAGILIDESCVDVPFSFLALMVKL